MDFELSNGPSTGEAGAHGFIAFKVMAVDPRRYIVTPSSGIIGPGPGSKVAVKVTLLALADSAEVDSFLKSKQKFLIKWRPLDGGQSPRPGVTARQLLVWYFSNYHANSELSLNLQIYPILSIDSPLPKVR